MAHNQPSRATAAQRCATPGRMRRSGHQLPGAVPEAVCGRRDVVEDGRGSRDCLGDRQAARLLFRQADGQRGDTPRVDPGGSLGPGGRIADRQRYDRRVNLAQNELLNKLDGIAVRGTDRQLGTTSL